MCKIVKIFYLEFENLVFLFSSEDLGSIHAKKKQKNSKNKENRSRNKHQISKACFTETLDPDWWHRT